MEAQRCFPVGVDDEGNTLLACNWVRGRNGQIIKKKDGGYIVFPDKRGKKKPSNEIDPQ